MTYAPIVLFVYNRPWHTRQTIEALQKNKLAEHSELFIYSDSPKNESVKAKVDEVRKYIKTIDGFKRVTIIEREENWGLARSIINGVADIVNIYGRIIVLEDDLITSPYFLNFMNGGLDFYEDEKKVWHISGWNYPIETRGLNDTFLWRVMNCWGWATWADRWQYFEKDTYKHVSIFSEMDRRRFNLDGSHNFWNQILLNRRGKIDTWAIYWYATIFKNEGLCLNPGRSFVENIGHDGTGVHCGINEAFKTELNHKKDIVFEKKMEENSLAVERIKEFYMSQKKPLMKRLINKVSRITVGKNILQ